MRSSFRFNLFSLKINKRVSKCKVYNKLTSIGIKKRFMILFRHLKIICTQESYRKVNIVFKPFKII